MLGNKSDLTRRLLRWYDRCRRDLPWRVPRDAPSRSRPDPYHVLVSEAMLQQTQVATVIPYFQRFLAAFPTVVELAEADDQAVLRAWQGLGYYSRARHLRAAAGQIVQRFGGRVPADLEALRSLPGVGAYTAGAIASIAYDLPAAAVDGNVARVITRLDRLESDPRHHAAQAELWERARALVPRRRSGEFNSAMMELGATVCTPRNPQCPLCPVASHCQALAAGAQEQIPAPRRAKLNPLLLRDVLCVRSGQAWLIEQRPPRGRWAGMWQFVTIPRKAAPPSRRDVARWAGVTLSSPPRRVGAVTHALTHRRYAFNVYVCTASDECCAGAAPASEAGWPRLWVSRARLEAYPLPRPQLVAAQMLDALNQTSCPG